MSNILVVDDDPHIRELISFALTKSNFSCFSAANGIEALQLFSQQQIDLVVLDINMAEMDGLECCREIRKYSEVPILFLSSRDEEIDRIIGLEIGGDDYVTKPFSPRELTARIKVILKRTNVQVKKAIVESDCQTIYRHGLLTINIEQYQVYWKQIQIMLTAIEFAMLSYMIKQPARVFSRDQIMNAAYSDNIHVSDRTIDSHIRHIRQKFLDVGCEKVIETQHGIGYKLGLCQ